MTRQYADQIHVRSSEPVDQAHGYPGAVTPQQFLWRGRLYLVREVLAHWLESAVWWGGSRQSLEGEIPAHEREVWRVEAHSGRSSVPGVFDICRDGATGQWMLTRTID